MERARGAFGDFLAFTWLAARHSHGRCELFAALASRLPVLCWLLRGSRPSDEAPGSQHPCECRAPRPRHNIDPREREPVRVSSPGSSKDRSLTAAAAIYAACWWCPQPLPIVRCQCADIPHQLRGLSPRGHQISTSSSPHPPSLIRQHRSRDLNTALQLAPH